MSIPQPEILLETRDSSLVKFKLPPSIIEVMDEVLAEIKDGWIIEPPIKVFGKDCNQPRDIQFLSNTSKGYFYSGQCAEAQPMGPACKKLLDFANEIASKDLPKPGVLVDYDAVLANKYFDGTKSVGDHSDSEAGLDKNAGVLAMSHGATRKFRIRNKRSKAIVGDYPMSHGTAFQMRGKFQEEFTHGIPVEKKVKDVRVSFTFRKHDPVTEELLWEKWVLKQSMAAQREAAEEEPAKRKREEEEEEEEEEDQEGLEDPERAAGMVYGSTGGAGHGHGGPGM